MFIRFVAFFFLYTLSVVFSSPFSLIFIVVRASCLLSLGFFYWGVSFLGLMWALVYMGGMIIIFVYVVFIQEQERHPHAIFKLGGGVVFFIFWGWETASKVVFFYSVKIKLEIYNQILARRPQFLSWEIYNQILARRPQFLFVLMGLILGVLIVVLGLLKKGISHSNLKTLE